MGVALCIDRIGWAWQHVTVDHAPFISVRESDILHDPRNIQLAAALTHILKPEVKNLHIPPLSKKLSEVCSHDSLQEPPQGDDVGMTSCPESNREKQHIRAAMPGHHVTSCDIV